MTPRLRKFLSLNILEDFEQLGKDHSKNMGLEADQTVLVKWISQFIGPRGPGSQ
jgi:hypothetical protein